MVDSDGQDLLLHKLGYSPTQYSLYLVPNSSLWAGVRRSSLTSLSSSNLVTQETIGTLLLERGRHFSLVLAGKAGKSKGRDNDVVVIEGEENSTPWCDVFGDSGYFTNHSSGVTSVDDVIMTSSSQNEPAEATKLNESCSTIVICDSECESEDPLVAFRTPSSLSLPQLLPHGTYLQAVKERPTFQSTSQYFLPPQPKPSSIGETPVIMDTNDPTCRCDHSCQPDQQKTSNDDVIVISSSDETPSAPFVGQQSDFRWLTGHSPQSIDEGIVLDSRWEGPGSINRPTIRPASVYRGQSSSGQERQVPCQQKASEQCVVVKCGGYDLTSADLRTLEPNRWLNDQVRLPA